jgi:hypothetical protein
LTSAWTQGLRAKINFHENLRTGAFGATSGNHERENAQEIEHLTASRSARFLRRKEKRGAGKKPNGNRADLQDYFGSRQGDERFRKESKRPCIECPTFLSYLAPWKN